MSATSPFRLRVVSAAICAAMLMPSGAANAIGLMQAYQAALKNDPVYRSAQAERDSGQQFRVIGRAGLLPQVQYSFSKSNNLGESISPPSIFNPRSTLTDLDYTSTSRGLTVRQTLFNLDAYARFKQGAAQTKYSEAQFDARAKELMVRLLGAYIEACFMEDQLALFRAQRDSYSEQMKVNTRLFEKGEGTKTEVLETQAKLDMSESLVLEASDNYLNAKNSLNAIVGEEVTILDSLRHDFKVASVIQGDFESWQQTAEKNNPEILAAQLAIEIANQEIRKSQAGHAPRVDLNANYNRGVSETVTTKNQDNNIRSLGFQLVIPIYSGGYVNAVSRQAAAQKEKAKADLDNTRSKVMNELRKQYNIVRTGVVKLDALQKAVTSAEALVEATTQSIKGGIRINVDLLNAQQQLVSAKRDLAQARYGFLASLLKLKVTAGVAAYGDLETVAGFFVTK
jgi:protease secretion system outer membrane protein